jgi:L-aspartate semialdehyde sulfurtransferase ferredoxin
MTKRQMKLTFPPELVTAPLIYNLVQDYRIMTNIHRADTAGEQGWVVLEMEGSDEDIEQGLAWVTAKGVQVEAIDSEP